MSLPFVSWIFRIFVVHCVVPVHLQSFFFVYDVMFSCSELFGAGDTIWCKWLTRGQHQTRSRVWYLQLPCHYLFAVWDKFTVVVCLSVWKSGSCTEADADVVAQSCSDVHWGAAVRQLSTRSAQVDHDWHCSSRWQWFVHTSWTVDHPECCQKVSVITDQLAFLYELYTFVVFCFVFVWVISCP